MSDSRCVYRHEDIIRIGATISIPGHEVHDEVILNLGMYGCEAAGAVDAVAVTLGDVLVASDDLVTVLGDIRDLEPSFLSTWYRLRWS